MVRGLDKRVGKDRTGVREDCSSLPTGSASDCIKLAMLKVSRSPLHGKGLWLLSQMHDELLFECEQSLIPLAVRDIRNAMEGAVQLRVPLAVRVLLGPSWGSLREVSAPAGVDGMTAGAGMRLRHVAAGVAPKLLAELANLSHIPTFELESSRLSTSPRHPRCAYAVQTGPQSRVVRICHSSGGVRPPETDESGREKHCARGCVRRNAPEHGRTCYRSRRGPEPRCSVVCMSILLPTASPFPFVHFQSASNPTADAP